jgi:isoquinoline 1-oxidoreductase beta subunit
VNHVVNLSRRAVLQASMVGGGALVLGISFSPPKARAASDTTFAPSAFLSIDSTGLVTVWVAKSEMGQGVRTSLPMIVAEELDADWSKVRVEQAIADPKYGRMTTGGSSSVRRSWQPLRQAGASAREMLVAAAARRWGVDASSCRTEAGFVVHPESGRRSGYGELASEAAQLRVPDHPRLKPPEQFRLVGHSLPRLDFPSKVDGSAIFGIDTRVPKMLVATVLRCPVFGGKVGTVEDAAARAVPGVRRIVPIDSGLAVVAESTWSALRGREALQVTWDEGPNAKFGQDDLWRLLRAGVARPGAAVRTEGVVNRALEQAARKLDVTYEAPLLAHAPLEPQNCIAHVRADGCEIWAPTQAPDRARETVAKALRMAPERVIVHTTLIGGGFGRRLNVDYTVEAAQIAREVGAPVQVLWTRADDFAHDFFRPPSVHRLFGALDRAGNPTAWLHRLSVPPRSPAQLKNGIDEGAIDGAADVPYSIPNLQVEYAGAAIPVPLGSWRSVSYSYNAFAVESFVDELAHLAGEDPLLFRRRLLSKSPRHVRVLDLVAEASGWGKSLPKGRARGVAVHECFESVVAEVVEVKVEPDGTIRVPRVVCGVDCGTVVHPDTVEAQVQGGVTFGLSAALREQITLDRGRVEQTTFSNYGPMQMRDAPVVEVHVVKTTEPPGGIGEPGVPPVAPAVANAVFAATGKRLRRLPFQANGSGTG